MTPTAFDEWLSTHLTWQKLRFDARQRPASLHGGKGPLSRPDIASDLRSRLALLLAVGGAGIPNSPRASHRIPANLTPVNFTEVAKLVSVSNLVTE